MSDKWQGSANGYGLINDHDVAFLNNVLQRVFVTFGEPVKILEVGIANGYTGRGMVCFLNKLGVRVEYHGIDGESGRPHEGVLPDGGTFHMGDSTEIFESIPDGFHLVFIDACHCNNHCCLDFLNYGPKVVVGGFVVFHDTNPSDKWQGLIKGHWQGHGPNTAAFNIATRQALSKLGLTTGHRTDWKFIDEQANGDGLGMMLYRRMA